MTDPVEPGGHLGLGDRLAATREARRNRRALDHARRERVVRTTSRATTAGADHPRRRNVAMISAAGASLAVISLLFLGPGSINIWMNQRRQTQALEAKITTLDRANDGLAARAKQLDDPHTIAYLARRNYGMVPKGAKSYAILPSPKVDDHLDGTWPFVDLHRTGRGPSGSDESTSTTSP